MYPHPNRFLSECVRAEKGGDRIRLVERFEGEGSLH
nr:MAG TPA: hypothetical protein [Caudoviricetes sp.]